MPSRAFRKEGLAHRVGPFVAVAAATAAEMALQFGLTSPVVAALSGVAILVAAIFVVPWDRLPRWTDAVIPFAYLGVVMLMRDAEGGRLASAGLLVLLPVVWFALFGGRTEVIASVIAGLGVFLLPPLLIGGDRYPRPEYGKIFVFGLVLTLVAGTVSRLVRERRELTEQLADLANRDPLTLLPNRRSWDAQLAQAVATAGLEHTPLCVAIVDLDNLKRINDLSGHEAGDAALRSVAAAWARTAPADAMVARIGGDEFGVLLPGRTRAEAEKIAGRLLQAALPYGCSIGVAAHSGSDTGSALMRAADKRLYLGKPKPVARASGTSVSAPVAEVNVG